MRFLTITTIITILTLLTACNPNNNSLLINDTNNSNNMTQEQIIINNQTLIKPFNKKIVFWNLELDELKINNDYLIRQLINTINSYDIIVLSGIKISSPLTFQRALKNNGLNKKITYFLEKKEGYYYFLIHDDDSDFKELTVFDNKNYYNNLLLTHLLLGGTKNYYLIFLDVKPEFSISENMALSELIKQLVQEKNINEKELIIIGSLYSDCYYADEIIPSGFSSLIDQDTTVTADACSYDRLIVGSDQWVCDFGVDYYDLSMKLSLDVANALSSHYPVFVSLCSDERGGAVV